MATDVSPLQFEKAVHAALKAKYAALQDFRHARAQAEEEALAAQRAKDEADRKAAREKAAAVATLSASLSAPENPQVCCGRNAFPRLFVFAFDVWKLTLFYFLRTDRMASWDSSASQR